MVIVDENGIGVMESKSGRLSSHFTSENFDFKTYTNIV